MAYFLGIAGSLLILLNFSLFSSRRINRRFYNDQNKILSKISSTIRAPHPVIGIAALAIGLVHGYLMLGGLPLHSGTLLCAILAVMGSTALLGRRLKIRNWLKAHRLESVFLALMLVVHFLMTKGFISF